MLLRLPLLTVLAALGVLVGRDHLAGMVFSDDDVHGLVKSLVEAWHALLLHLPRDARQGALWLAAAALVPLLPGRARLGGAVLVTALTGFTVGFLPTGLVLVALVAANLVPPRWPLPRPLLLVPGVELLLPLPTLAALGWEGRAWARLVAALPLALAWPPVDALLGAFHYEHAVSDWPDGRSDPRVEILGRSDEGVRCDWHDVDVLPAQGDALPRAVVVAEYARQLYSFSLPPLARDPAARTPPPAPSGWPLPPWWGREQGLVMDSETDPAAGRTWYVDGPTRVRGMQWRADGWATIGQSAPLPIPQTHAYTVAIPERNELVVVSVNARHPNVSPAVQILTLDGMQLARSGRPRDAAGMPLPTVREIAWVPPLGRLVLAPDFGDRLYLVDPETLAAEAWTELPTVDGKLGWIPGMGRLGVAVPSERALRLVDPATGEVDRVIPTQPGVRAFAVDEERGLLLTASVVTGAILVQQLDGTVVDAYPGLMPMVRELELVPGRPEAILSTWTRLYRVRYAD